MSEPNDFDALSAAFDRAGVWYRVLPEEDALKLASWFAEAMPATPSRGLEVAGGDVMFFDSGDAYLGKGSWAGSPPAFFARGEEDARDMPRREKERNEGHEWSGT